MISMADAEKAVDWLRDNAARMAQERAERLYMEKWVQTVKATLQNDSGESSAAKAEIVALASPTYLAALQAYREAVEKDETNRFLITAAEAKIEAWRSQESTRRAEGKAYT
jgi:translation elongation factor EF-Ts